MAASESRRASSLTSPAAGRREHLRFIDHDERGEPLVARCVEHGGEELRRAAHLRFQVEPVERQNDRGAVAANPRGQLGQFGAAISRAVDHDMPERRSQRDEVAFRIDHHLLDERGALLQQSPQQVGFARAAIALHEQPGRQQFLDVDAHRRAGRVVADDDGIAHGPALKALGRRNKAFRPVRR